jgi:biotin operon repressor
MESKQNRTLKEFDSLYKMIDDVYHEIALSMHLTDSAFLILYCLLELGDGCSQKDICKLYSISKQTVNSSVKSLEDKGVLIRKAASEGISTYFLQSLDENFLKNISVLSLIWKMLHLNLWSLRSVNSCFLLRENMFRF